MPQEMIVAIGPCWSCLKSFPFDPDKVPSISVCRECDSPPDMHADACTRQGEILKEPLCGACVKKVNRNRELMGQPLINVIPGAYPAL